VRLLPRAKITLPLLVTHSEGGGGGQTIAECLSVRLWRLRRVKDTNMVRKSEEHGKFTEELSRHHRDAHIGSRSNDTLPPSHDHLTDTKHSTSHDQVAQSDHHHMISTSSEHCSNDGGISAEAADHGERSREIARQDTTETSVSSAVPHPNGISINTSKSGFSCDACELCGEYRLEVRATFAPPIVDKYFRFFCADFSRRFFAGETFVVRTNVWVQVGGESALITLCAVKGRLLVDGKVCLRV
jgi:hypothetical protein